MVIAETLTLLQEAAAVLPVDPVQENYVRKVKNCIFSIAFPTPFESRVRLVAVSKEVLEDILDLDLSVSETDDFIQLVSGEKIVSESVPLAHRYGGHQFGIWADQLGDGRAHLIGTYMNRTLLDFIIVEHFPSIDVKEPDRYVDFFSTVVSETAQLIALWMSVGFAHDFVPNTSDDERRYKIGNQANIGMFNLDKLLQALNPLLDLRQKQL
ncbi:Selenoprotein O [Sciurus carolinensis]|uniref:Selenoprotein O n=1 Tax=Sciurus carolinensis TaxID=30640 RepID=A0AA41SXD6_SCICA|nr:Selenoprotein O [Sciurus carolinensis]